MLGAYGGLVYCVPVIGGLLADRYLGMRKAVVFGGLLLVRRPPGHGGRRPRRARSVNGVVVRDEGALQVFYLSLSLIIIGVGFLKPNISTIVGTALPRRTIRAAIRASRCSMPASTSARCSPRWCAATSARRYGWKLGLRRRRHRHAAGPGACSCGARSTCTATPSRRDPARLRERVFGLPREWAIYLGTMLGLVPIAALMWAAGQRRFALGGEISLALLLMLLVMLAVLALVRLVRHRALHASATRSR